MELIDTQQNQIERMNTLYDPCYPHKDLEVQLWLGTFAII